MRLWYYCLHTTLWLDGTRRKAWLFSDPQITQVPCSLPFQQGLTGERGFTNRLYWGNTNKCTAKRTTAHLEVNIVRYGSSEPCVPYQVFLIKLPWNIDAYNGSSDLAFLKDTNIYKLTKTILNFGNYCVLLPKLIDLENLSLVCVLSVVEMYQKSRS